MPQPPSKVLVIDDEPQIGRFIAIGLEHFGYSVSVADTGTTGLNMAISTRPDLIILDLVLPDMNGLEVLKLMRSWSDVPVIVLSIEACEEQTVRLLRSGADDYVIKPFGINELAARCGAALRRYHKAVDKETAVRTGPLTINLVTRAVTLRGQHVTLTRQEYDLLHLLASHLGLVMTHNQLIKNIWDSASPENIPYLRMLVRRLRQKLEADPSRPTLLISESRVGYRLASNAPSAATP
jgi:two-component system, OmpR family, KDP operon response regulator KdpE